MLNWSEIAWKGVARRGLARGELPLIVDGVDGGVRTQLGPKGTRAPRATVLGRLREPVSGVLRQTPARVRD
jgi:hypothetical protein